MKERFKEWKHPKIEEGKLTKYNWMVQNKDGLKLGYKTDIGAFTYINAKNGVIIEDFVQVGSHCSLYSESTIDNKAGQIKLKKNCKIGSHSLIMPGVTVGENAVIGAFSFVNRNVPDNVVAAGVPIKIIKKLEGE
ncbi:putative acetyltransferase [subsurface metagenome]